MIDRPVTLTLSHRVYFTEGVFVRPDSVLHEVLGKAETGRHRKALVIVEAQVAAGQPGLVESISAWFAAQPGGPALAAPPLVIRGGEPCKNDWTLVEQLWSAIHRAGIDRHSYVIVIGGGALLDLAGFAAATAHRGIRLVRMPTTTLSQGDGGVGVKNGVNYFRKKNWIGTFAVPFAVINDFTFLRSLPPDDRRDGVIEAIKVSLIRDRAFYEELAAQPDALGRLDAPLLHRIIQRSAELHVEHICTGGDPFEFGSARPLDFGHWVAHKLEQITAFRLSHGKAVAIGMAVDLEYAALAGLLAPAARDAILTVIEAAGFRLWDEGLLATGEDGRLTILRGLEEFREHLGGELCITLVTAPGQAVEVHEMDPVLVEAALRRLKARALYEAPGVAAV